MTTTPPIAKTTRPRVQNVVARPRLFERIEEFRSAPVIWIVAQAGAGKTTLVSTYLETYAGTDVWYNVDHTDNDPAAFFQHLREAAIQADRKAASLPLFTLEFHQDLDGFARRFFRRLFASLGGPSTIVFDNVHELTEDSRLHSCLADATDEIPYGSNVIILSRNPPPASYARLRANRQLGLIEWKDLRLTSEESREIAVLDGRTSTSECEQLHIRSDGWVAGLILLLESLHRGCSIDEMKMTQNLHLVFDYFATQVYESYTPEEKMTLLALAHLPHMTADLACSLTGDSGAGVLLESMVRRHLFTERRQWVPEVSPRKDDLLEHRKNTGQYIYQFHALFRNFLLYHGEQTLPVERRRLWLGHAGSLLDASGNVDEAILLFLSSEAWSSAATTIRRSAPAAFRAGRWASIQRWIGALPEIEQSMDPWLKYWKGACEAILCPAEGRAVLSSALDDFLKIDDLEGAILCACAIIRSHYFENVNLPEMKRWLDRLTLLLGRKVSWSSPEVELSSLCSAIMAILHTHALAEAMDRIARRMSELIEHPEIDRGARMEAAIFLLWYFNDTGRFESCKILSRIGNSLVTADDVSDLLRSSWYCASAWWQAFADYSAATDSYDKAISIAQKNGLLQAEFMACHLAVFMHAMWNNLPEAMRQSESARRVLDEKSANRPVEGGFFLAALDLGLMFIDKARQDTASAREHAKRAWLAVGRTPSSKFITVWGACVADAFAAAGRNDTAEEVIREARRAQEATCFDCLDSALLLQSAYVKQCSGDATAARLEAREALLLAMRDSRQRPFLRWVLLGSANVLLADLLDDDVFNPFLCELLTKWQFPAPDWATEQWPWAVRISTLGRFSIMKGSEPIAFSRKAPKRLLSLLQCLISFGGKNVPCVTLMDALWSDLDGDAAYDAFEVAVRRLRDLLGWHESIQIQNGEVSLDCRRIWVDKEALERIASDYGRAPEDAVEQLMRIYRGNFLPNNDEEWAVAARAQIKRRVIGVVDSYGRTLERAMRAQDARAFYNHVGEFDGLQQISLDGLLRCQSLGV